MLTSFADDDALFQAIMAGASGYVLKQVKGVDLVDAVRRVAAGEALLDPTVTARVLDRFRSGPDADPRLEALTGQERRILDLIAEGLTNRQIAARVHLAEKTVKNYVSNLLTKLGMERRTQAAVYAAGLRDAAPPARSRRVRRAGGSLRARERRRPAAPAARRRAEHRRGPEPARRAPPDRRVGVRARRRPVRRARRHR